MNDAASAIIEALPHRPPFRFLTEITELVPRRSGEAIWRLTGGEAILAGHFPGLPIVPGTLITEALAQLSGLVAFYPATEPREEGGCGSGAAGPATIPATLAHADVRFKKPVAPPAEILLRSRLRRAIGAFRQFDVTAAWYDKVVARGELTLAAARVGCPTHS